MLAELINDAVKGKKVSLKTKFVSEIITIPRDGHSVDTNVLSVEYSGRVDGKPFKIKKNYLFAEDNIRHPLECTLIANNRLQLDYNRLKKAGIKVKERFFYSGKFLWKAAGGCSDQTAGFETSGLHSTLPGRCAGIGGTDS